MFLFFIRFTFLYENIEGHHQESKQELTAHIIACGGMNSSIPVAEQHID